jgi:DNA polymerase III subunit delta'
LIFSDIIGHENIRINLSNAIESGTLSHAHLIIGESGIGKSLIAKEIAAKVLGKTDIKQYVDMLEFKNKKRSIGIDDVRIIIEEINKRPYEGNNKVIIIYEGEKITSQAQNALLKTIEEPPKGVYIFILCENSELILETIKSRCQIHRLNRLNGEEISKFLTKKYPHLRSDEFQTIVSFCDGVPGRAERFVEDEDFKTIRDTCIKLLISLNEIKEIELLRYTDFLSKYKEQWEDILTIILSYIRDIMVYKDVGKEGLIVNKDKLNEIKEASSMFSFNKLNGIIGVLRDTRVNLNNNVNIGLTYDIMLLNMLEA